MTNSLISDIEEVESSDEHSYSCWVILGIHANTYCFESTEEWPEPGFQEKREGESYLSFSTDPCPEEYRTGFCSFGSDAGGDY